MSKTETVSKSRAVLELLASNGQLTGEDIANQCSFETRMAAAGIIAMLRRQKAIELVPESYRITDAGKSILETKEQVKEQSKKERSQRQSEPRQVRNQTKAQQIVILTRAFQILNPDRDPSEIDFNSVVDETLHISENRDNLAKYYPGYRWRKRPENREPPTEDSQDAKAP